MADIKKTVSVSFVAADLNKFEEDVKKAVPFLTKKGSKDAANELLGKMEGIRALIHATNGQMSNEAAQTLFKEYKEVIQKVNNIRKSLLSAENKQMRSEANKIEASIAKIEATIKSQESIIRASKASVHVDKDEITTSKKFRQENIRSAVKAEPTVFDKGFLNLETGKFGVSLEIYEKSLKQIKEISEKIGITEKDKQLTMEQINLLTVEDLKTRLETAGIDNISPEQLKIELIKQSRMAVAEANAIEVEIVKQRTAQNKLSEEDKKLQKEKNNLLTKEKEIAADMANIKPGDPVTSVNLEMLDSTSKATDTLEKEIADLSKSAATANNEGKALDKGLNKQKSSLQKATQNVFSYGLAFQALRRIYRETIGTIKELDHAMTEMAVVTNMNREETWKLVPTMQRLAKETGFTTTEISKLSTIYFRQGRTLKDVIELTEVAAKAARVAGISAVESANYLTAAVNGFGLAASEAERVSDKFAALAASSASSYEELAVGLSKYASQAKIAGLDMDFALGLLAKGVETTREAPESIGTALKTVLARMRELTDLGKTFEDGMDVNRVEVALKQVGVQLRDTNGVFRDMQTVITEVGSKWALLNKNQQASVAVALAGTRQQSRLISIFQDFDRTLELVNISSESAGATIAQHLEYMQGMEAAMTKLRTSWQQFITTITESEVIISMVNMLSNTIEKLSSFLDSIGLSGKNAMITILGFFGAIKAGDIVLKLLNTTFGESIFMNKLYTAILLRNTNAEERIAAVRAMNSVALKHEIFEMIVANYQKKLMIKANAGEILSTELGTAVKKRAIIVSRLLNIEMVQANALLLGTP